jgi:hypothetical protein
VCSYAYIFVYGLVYFLKDNVMVIECIFIGFLSAIGWWGANYYVITPYLPEPVFKEKRVEDKKIETPVLIEKKE